MWLVVSESRGTLSELIAVDTVESQAVPSGKVIQVLRRTCQHYRKDDAIDRQSQTETVPRAYK